MYIIYITQIDRFISCIHQDNKYLKMLHNAADLASNGLLFHQLYSSQGQDYNNGLVANPNLNHQFNIPSSTTSSTTTTPNTNNYFLSRSASNSSTQRIPAPPPPPPPVSYTLTSHSNHAQNFNQFNNLFATNTMNNINIPHTISMPQTIHNAHQHQHQHQVR